MPIVSSKEYEKLPKGLCIQRATKDLLNNSPENAVFSTRNLNEKVYYTERNILGAK